MLINNRLLSRSCGLLLAGAGLALSAPASAVTTFQLSNHPDSGAIDGIAPPTFGLRLDGLTTNAPDEIYVFDFDALGAMFMDYDDGAGTIHIYGQSLGGIDADSGICSGGCTDVNGNGLEDTSEHVWGIDFVYDVGVVPVANGGVDDLFVVANHDNFGMLSSPIYGSYDLRDHANSFGLSFRFNDGDGSELLAATGWLDYLPEDLQGGGQCVGQSGLAGWCGSDQNTGALPTPYTSDWRFTATVVPVPAAAWLLGSGLIALAGVARRRQVS